MPESPCIEALDTNSLVGGNITSVLTALVTRAHLIGQSLPSPCDGSGNIVGTGEWGLRDWLVAGVWSPGAWGRGEWGLGSGEWKIMASCFRVMLPVTKIGQDVSASCSPNHVPALPHALVSKEAGVDGLSRKRSPTFWKDARRPQPMEHV